MIIVENKKKKIENIRKKHPYAEIVDLTSNSESKFIKFSPFYPVGNIPGPYSKGQEGMSVEGIWQGLKVFESQGADFSKFSITNMKGLKRSIRVNGPIVGHQKGMFSSEILDYITARETIFVTCYRWVLDNKLQELTKELCQLAGEKDIVFLDYNVNEDIQSLKKPLSHAALVKSYIEENVSIYVAPTQGTFDF